MAGRVIRVAPRQTYSWNLLTTNMNTVFWLGARAYPVLEAVSGVIHVAVSSGSALTTGATALIEVVNVLVSADEPNVTFASTGNVGSVSLSITETQSAPILKSGVITLDAIGAMIGVRMTYTQGSGGSSTLIAAVDLVLRDS